MKGHVSCRNISVSPNYVHSGTQLTLTCDVGGSIVNGTAFFRRNSEDLGSIQYDHKNNCYVNSSSTPCPSTCSCDGQGNRMIWQYTPLSTPSSDQTFYCDFIGESGSFTTSTTVKRAVLPLITISPPQSSYNVTIRRTLGPIQCVATCWPSCNIKWFGPKGSFNKNENLTLTNIQKTDSGQYLCQASNVLSTNNSINVKVTVQYGPETIILSPPTQSYTRNEGDLIGSIKCLAECEPSCDFEWTYPDGTQVNSTTLPQLVLKKSHHGQYKCKASNGIASKVTTITINVNYAPENIELLPSKTLVIVNEFHNFYVSCSADCRPSCNYMWTSQVHFSPSNSQLRITSVKRTHAGSYRCSVRNSVGTRHSSSISLKVYTQPTKVDKMTVVCTGATTASIAWIPDMTVVPGENFTVKYKTNSGQLQLFPFEEPLTKDDIYLLQIDSLSPSTEYTFTMESKNGLGRAESNEFTCTTMAASEESEVSGALIGGIVLISIALLLIIIVIALILLRKFRILTTDLSTLPCACPNCITTCIQRISRLSKKDEGPYMNTVHTNYVNTTINEPQEGNVNTEVTTDDNGSDKPYDDLVRRTSNSSEKPYDNLHMSPTGTQNDQSSHYANYENVKKMKKKNEKVALKPPPRLFFLILCRVLLNSLYRKNAFLSAERLSHLHNSRTCDVPDTTPTTDETFSCEINGINVQERNCTTVRAAALQSVTLSPLTTELNVTQGKTPRSITCSAVCWPICTFRWIGPNHFNRNGPELTLKVIPKSGSGTYWCQAKNVIGTKNSTNITITVQYGPDTIVVFPSELNGRYIRTEGDSIRNITCWADCHPVCNYTWTYPDKTTNVTSYFYKYALEKIHDGEYTYGPDTIVVFPSELNGRYIRTEGDSIRNITCWADCHPVCNYTWTYPDKTTNVTSYFYKYALEKIHDGEYTCRAFNEIGSKEKTIRVVVNYAPENIQLSPNITPIIVQENMFDSITCSANCRPQCEYKWTGQTRWSAWNNLLFRRNVKDQTVVITDVK
ncbi:unnamed protein product [Mytilus edulis]|uniref:Uncharacterized protein n=1 Tax=Mytilus edulis TaxID=6550 RepID=A0A8S3SAM6_MYTED|nr:unnamed protein product [Mytilus edulis]CAG2214022.1 unnamed protein product [Mytilus edulis]